MLYSENDTSHCLPLWIDLFCCSNLTPMLTKVKVSGRIKALFAAIVIPLAILAAWLIYSKVLGDPSNFVGDNPKNEPLVGNYLGVIYKGGPVVILLITFQITLLIYTIERFLTIFIARGKKSNKVFLMRLQELLDNNQREEAVKECDKQKGSLANVIKTGLLTYTKVEKQEKLPFDLRVDMLEKELEEARLLELPMLTENMIVISTLASISTLIGLFGTVTGMIKAFASLARVGAPDAVGLAGGISQALITTALGIATAAVAIVVYNFFNTRIRKIVTAIEESAYSIVHTFKTTAFSEAEK